MQKAVKKCEKSEHPTEFYQLIPAEIFSERRNGKRDKQKSKRQNAGRAKKKLDRICAEFLKISIPREKAERHERVDKN